MPESKHFLRTSSLLRKVQWLCFILQDFTIPPHETYRSEKKPVYELEKDRQLAVSIFGNMNMMENNYERQRASDADGKIQITMLILRRRPCLENGGVYLLVVHVAIISNTQPVAKCHRYAYIQKATTFADIAFRLWEICKKNKLWFVWTKLHICWTTTICI